MHGTGNDYVYINLFEGFDDSVPVTYDKDGKLLTVEGEDVSKVAIKVSDRHFSIGADGLICVAPSRVRASEDEKNGADVRMIMFNADGSEGLMCGNGIRCVAKFAFDKRLLSPEIISTGENTGSCEIKAETASGIKTLKLTVEKDKASEKAVCTYVEVNMGQAILKAEDIPVKVAEMGAQAMIATDDPLYGADVPKGAVIKRMLRVDGKDYSVTCVSMGNPHCVVFMKDSKGTLINDSLGGDVDGLELEKIGPLFENHPAFPEKINTEFVEVIDDHTVKMRVWERGSGETLSCGTGTCAVTVAAVLNGFVKRGTEVEVKIRGGSLYDTWLETGEVLMKGPAETSFVGEC